MFPATTRTFTKDTALSEQGRGAAWHVWINGTAWQRHGRGVWIGLKRSLLELFTVCLPFSSDHVGYLHSFQFFVLSTNATITQSIEDQMKTYRKMNNCSINFNGRNMYDLWLCSKACDGEFCYPWWNICDSSDVENLPSVVTSHTSTTWAGTENRLPVGNDDLHSGCWGVY